MTPGDRPGAGGGAGRRAIAAWCLYDWANSGFPTVVITFVFSAYVTKYVAESATLGIAQWGTAISLSALTVAMLSPLLGAIADNRGRRKPWLFAFTGLCILTTFGLWTIEPEPTSLVPALVLVALSNAAFEFCQVFYNAMLPDVAPRHMLGRISGWAWSCGYYGGLAVLIICLLVFALPEEPVFGLDKQSFEHLRITGPLVALWFALFALPLFLVTPDRPASGVGLWQGAQQGIATLIRTVRQLRRYRNIARYLLARMVYTDGLNTVFVVGGAYAANTFGMEFAEILTFGILLNVTAGLGA
ncbi:MAG: MFS transporter, partial [Rhodospirillales bacterium]|nr:MFS transporter [Rhodospirillales bacterium]